MPDPVSTGGFIVGLKAWAITLATTAVVFLLSPGNSIKTGLAAMISGILIAITTGGTVGEKIVNIGGLNPEAVYLGYIIMGIGGHNIVLWIHKGFSDPAMVLAVWKSLRGIKK